MSMEFQDNKELRFWVLLGALGASSTAVQLLESPLPRILPWLKPGLSNVLVLFGIVRLSPFSGFRIVIIRTFLTGIALGTLFSPGNLLSLIGGGSAALIMGILYPWTGSFLSLYGLSVIGALTNNFSQLFVVGNLFGDGIPLWMNLAVMIWISIPAGILVGYLTNELLRRTS